MKPTPNSSWGSFRLVFLPILLFVLPLFAFAQSVSFNTYGLGGESLNNPTSLEFGPDGRLYVAQQDGTIYIYTITRDDAGSVSYQVTDSEQINIIKTGTPNHNDDGATNSEQKRQVTGLLVAGTAENPVIYVTSSDWRIAVGDDSGLDTNSGVLSRLTWNGSSWVKVDLVRGFPRCEENHSINGMDLDESTNTMYVMVGGITNKGAPSNNFSGTPEYFLSAALLSIDLDQLNAMPVYTDPRTNTAYVYDLPTIDDPTRTNIQFGDAGFPYTDPGHPLHNASIDPGDPFGGNNGLNQAFPEPGGPVQIYSPGYRNAYDVLFASTGKLYTSDNGPNGGWGGVPLEYDENDNLVGNVGGTLDPGHYITNEFNESGSTFHGDVLHYISGPSYYGGHPTAIRAFPKKSGIFVYQEISGSWQQVGPRYDWENLIAGVQGYFNASFSITDFPDNPTEGVYTVNDMTLPGRIHIKSSSTNGICEYTAGNFGGAMQGNLLTASWNGDINRYVLNAAGNNDSSNEVLFSGFGSSPLDIIAQGDSDPFPGTIWAATYGSDNITIFEPADYNGDPVGPCTGADDDTIDEDGDLYTNADEIANGTDPCNGGSIPDDNDGSVEFGAFKRSNLLDTDDDDDGILDLDDPFSIDPDNGMTTTLPINYPFWNNDPGTGFFGLGFTGLMSNGSTDWIDMYDEDNLAAGGAAGKFSVESVPAGDALGTANDQQYAFLFGVNNGSNAFVIHSKLEPPYFSVNGVVNVEDFITNNESVAPEESQSFGIFVGPGDQDNYLKLVFNSGNSGNGGLGVILEVGGTVTSSNSYDVAGILNASAVELYFVCDPASNTVQPYYSLDNGTTVLAVGSPIAVPAAWLAPDDSDALAIGVIATSGNSGLAFGATWDFITVQEDMAAELAAAPSPLDFGGVVAESGLIALDLQVTNQGGPTAGSVSITGLNFTGTDDALFSTTQSLPIPVGIGNTVNIPVSFTPGAATGTKSASLEIVHTGDNSPLIVPLTAEVLEPLAVLYRINAGGAALASLDAPNPDWNVDTNTEPSPYRVAGGGSVTSTAFNNRDGVPAYVPDGIFSQERWDPPTGDEMKWEFPADISGTYVVRLFLMNNFSGTDMVGERVFDVLIEGNVVLDNYDIVADVGHKTATVKEIQVSVTDGTLDLEFLHVVENPLINGIEILGPSSGVVIPPVTIASIPDQVNAEGDGVDLSAVASGGDPNENFTYAAQGLPPGVDIEPTNGLIFGTIDAGAVAGSPYQVTITASKPSSTPAQTTFNWTVLGPVSPGDILFRINAGGPLTANVDKDWSEDQSAVTANGAAEIGTPSPYVNSEVQDLTFGVAPGTLTNTTPYPSELFITERYNTNVGTPNNMQWDFPVPNGDYEVNLLFAELWSGAQSPGIRVFDVFIEGQLVLNDLDQTAKYGWNTAAVETFNVTVADGNLDIDFIKIVQNPAIKGIEIIASEGGQEPETNAAALITVLANNSNINSSTFNNGSFKVENTSAGGQKVEKVILDLSTTLLPEMVFDPAGTAGDLTAKGFTVNSNGNTGTITHVLGQPWGNGGFRQLDIEYTDFNAGEAMTFSIDVDPTSISMLPAPGPGESGSVSGLELTGATITVIFDDGSSLTNQLYSDGSNGGALANVNANASAGPAIAITGLTSPTTTNTAAHTVEITGGPPNGTVSLLRMEGAFFEGGGDLNQMPYEVNSIIGFNRLTSIALNGSGAATVNVTLTDNNAEGGYNYFIAAAEDAPNVFGNTSNPFIVLYDANLTNLPPSISPITDVSVLEGETATASISATDNENDDLTITFELVNTFDNSVVDPAGYTFTDNGDGTAAFSWVTAVGDAGVYQATVSVSDGVNAPATAFFQVTVTGDNTAPVVTNPGSQSSQEGDVINLPIAATDTDECGDLTYEATGLPPGLEIDPATGVISGTIEAGTSGGTEGAWIEQNGIVVIEMESIGTLPGNWKLGPSSDLNANNISNPEAATGGQFIIWEGSQFLGTPGNGLLTYQVQINNPGIYRAYWRNQVGFGTASSEHNDTWMKIEADAFYGDDEEGSIVCPDDIDPSTNDCVGNPVVGSSSNGWFKVYGTSLNWTWATFTNDFDAHPIFARFDAPGTYNILVSARSSYHVLDRLVLEKSDYSGNPFNLNLPESPRVTEGEAGSPGAADGSPYNVTVTVTDNCQPPLSNTVEFVWEVTPQSAQDATLNLTVQSQGRTDFSGEHTVELYDPADTDNPVYQFTSTANAQGVIQLTGIAPDNYLVWVDRAKYLSRVKSALLTAGTNSMTLLIGDSQELRAGDANEDNQVTLLDFSILATTFGLQPGADNYDERADFNDDDIVNLLDFSLLSSNFNVFGETPLTAGQEIEIRDQPVTGTADLYLQWERDQVLPGEEVTAELVLRAGAQQTDGVAGLFRYDPERLELIGIEWTDAFDLPLREVVDPQRGALDLAIGTLTNYVAGEQVVARVHFRTKAEGRTALRFAEEGRLQPDVTFAGVSVLGQLQGAELEIGDAAAPAMSLRVFPVPARDRVNVEVKDPADPDRIELRVYNAAGQLMQRQMLTQPSVILEQLAPGMYILEVSSGQDILHSRIIME